MRDAAKHSSSNKYVGISLFCFQIFLELDGEKKEGVEFLDTTLTIGKADQVLDHVNFIIVVIKSKFSKTLH